MATRRRTTRRKKISAKAVRQRLMITHLAHQGDGVAETETGKIYVPATLPRETIEADVIGDRGSVVQVLERAENRVSPPCPSFGSCGGCSLQHMSRESYEAWKFEQLSKVLHAHNLDAELRPMVTIEKGSRRRATFAAERRGGDLKFGFHGTKSHQIIPIDNCLILVPAIEQAIKHLRTLAKIIAPKRGVIKVHVLATETGLDVRLDDHGDWPDFKIERALMDHTIKAGFARLSLGKDVLIETTSPILSFGSAKVTPPPGGFTQAAQQSENILAKLVLDAVGAKKNILDLFAGSGTFTLRLAAHARVHGVEGDAAAISALEKSARSTANLKPVTTEKRDLFRRPLMAKELNKFDAIVLDPPRAGAAAQIDEICKSDHDLVVYVSCSPASFARDVETLQKAGFELSRVTPVDQFLFSHHIELVGVFHKQG
ncbi:MAG: class I SAM-dependent RNA methyltransferase [Hyphomicrobiales bacterium]